MDTCAYASARWVYDNAEYDGAGYTIGAGYFSDRDPYIAGTDRDGGRNAADRDAGTVAADTDGDSYSNRRLHTWRDTDARICRVVS